jgi:hypothetical protein
MADSHPFLRDEPCRAAFFVVAIRPAFEPLALFLTSLYLSKHIRLGSRSRLKLSSALHFKRTIAPFLLASREFIKY